MTHRIIRFAVLGAAAALMLAAMAGCFGGGEEPEPTATPDLDATIAAAVQQSVPTETPVPPTETPVPPTDTPVPPTDTPVPPTDTPVPEPTPDIAATVAAMMAATVEAQPTDTPVPPTNTPIPPTNTPVPNPAREIPCIVAGTVRDGGSPVANVMVYARVQGGTGVVAEDQTDANGRYALSITNFDQVFDLFVGPADSNSDTPRTTPGCRVIRDLGIN